MRSDCSKKFQQLDTFIDIKIAQDTIDVYGLNGQVNTFSLQFFKIC